MNRRAQGAGRSCQLEKTQQQEGSCNISSLLRRPENSPPRSGNRHQPAWMMYRLKDAFGSSFTWGCIGQSDSIWINVSYLNIQDNDKVSFKQGQLLIVKGWSQNRSLMVWPLSPKLSGNGLNSFGNRWQYCRFCRGCGLCISRSHLDVLLIGTQSCQSSLLSKPWGFEKCLIIHFASK